MRKVFLSLLLFLLTASTVSAYIPKTVKVSDNDSTAGYLNGKLVAGDGITFTEGSDGGDETLTLEATSASVNWSDISGFSDGYVLQATPTSVEFVSPSVATVNWDDITSGEIQQAGINWSSITDFANGYVLQGVTGGSVKFASPSAASVNWDEIVNGELQTAGMNWDSVVNAELQSSGFNWSSVSSAIQATGVNWSSLSNSVQKAGVNWSSWPSVYTEAKGISIETPTDADNLFFFKAPFALTVTRVTGIVEAATSAVLTVQECDSAGDNCSTVESVTADIDGAISTSIDNASIDAGDILRLDVGTVTGTVGQAHLTMDYTKD